MMRARRPWTVATILAAAAVLLSVALHAQPARSAQMGNDVIAGTVISGATGDPLAGSFVYLSEVMSRSEVAEAITGNDGRFQFAHLRDGRYDLRAAHRGYVTSGYDEHDQMMDSAVVTGAGLDTADLRVALPPDAAIHGKVTEDSGDPVPNARVTLYTLAKQDGSGRMTRARVLTADQMGNFDSGGLNPGNYYVCATGTPWYARPPGGAGDGWAHSPLNMAYPIGCYPDGTEPAGAAAVTVNGGDRARVDLVLHPVHGVQITFQNFSYDPHRGFTMPQLSEEVFGLREGVSGIVTSSVNDNHQDASSMTIREYGIPPGQYDVSLNDDSSAQTAAHEGTLDTSSGDLSLDSSSLPVLPDVTGTVAMADGGGVPDGLSVALVSDENAQSISYTSVAADGSFRVSGARPGNYELSFRGNGAPFVVAAMSAKGAGSQGRILEIGKSPVEVMAVVGRANASIYGKVESAGKAAPGVFVLLMPTDPGAGRDAWLPNQTDSDGSFIYPYVPPGNYRLIAIQQGWTLHWAAPGAVAAYLGKSLNVTVGPASTRIVLKEPLEAQAK